MCSWSTFGAQTSHGQPRIHKTHHGQDLGEATTFPFKVLSMPSHRASTQMSFCLGLGSPEIPKIGTPAILEAHNFVCRPSIEVRSEAKSQPLLRAFQRFMARHLHIRKSGRFPTFSGWELRRSALRLAITCVSNTPMDHASPFHTFTFQKLFNDIRNFSIQ